MFRLTIWSRTYEKIGTIERSTAGDLLDLGSRLQRDYGVVCELEHVFCPDCGHVCFKCLT